MTAPAADTLHKTGAFSALRQFARKKLAAEACEMCSQPLAAEHQHLIEPAERKIVCACDACALLFTTQAGTKLRRVPRNARYLPEFRLSDTQWNSLMIPIELVFFFHSSVSGRIVALYPSPAGATESLLSLNLWHEIARDNPIVSEMTSDVEALLVNRVGMNQGVEPAYYIAPIDKCYELVGLIRSNWRGLSGGTAVWREIGGFFAKLRERATVAQGAAGA
jgi:hypothetical protein